MRSQRRSPLLWPRRDQVVKQLLIAGADPTVCEARPSGAGPEATRALRTLQSSTAVFLVEQIVRLRSVTNRAVRRGWRAEPCTNCGTEEQVCRKGEGEGPRAKGAPPRWPLSLFYPPLCSLLLSDGNLIMFHRPRAPARPPGRHRVAGAVAGAAVRAVQPLVLQPYAKRSCDRSCQRLQPYVSGLQPHAPGLLLRAVWPLMLRAVHVARAVRECRERRRRGHRVPQPRSCVKLDTPALARGRPCSHPPHPEPRSLARGGPPDLTREPSLRAC